MSARRLGLPGDFKRRLQAMLPAYKALPANIAVVPRTRHHRPCDAGDADYWEVLARYPEQSESALDTLEEALKAVPGVHVTTQVRRTVGSSWRNTFTNAAWPAALGSDRGEFLRPQVLAVIRDEEPPTGPGGKAPEPSIFRCAKCGDGTRLRGWVHVNAHGPVSANGVIEHYDYWNEDADEVIEESVTCQVHGEGFIEKLVGGQYTSAMMNGKFALPDGERP